METNQIWPKIQGTPPDLVCSLLLAVPSLSLDGVGCGGRDVTVSPVLGLLCQKLDKLLQLFFVKLELCIIALALV